ncbi:zinc finger, CCHC-type containing protein [Tanacetum coccineum]
MDVKTTFLNGELDEKVYMNQPQGFIILGNENKVCKLIKSLYRLKYAPKQWHQKFDEVVLSNGYLLKKADKCVYSKFDESGKRVIICLYVDDMLIFGTDQGILVILVLSTYKQFRRMETLKQNSPFLDQEGLQELKKIAVRFEEKAYTTATSQSDYFRTISLKMLIMEIRSQNHMPDAMQANNGLNPLYPSMETNNEIDYKL